MERLTKKTDIHYTYTLGKIAYNGKRKENLSTVKIGFTYLNGNKESYFSVTGDVWNRIHTDILCGGCGTPEYLLKEYFPKDGLLRKIVELADKWHLTSFSKIPKDAMIKIKVVMDEVKARNDEWLSE